MKPVLKKLTVVVAVAAVLAIFAGHAASAETLKGQVLGAGGPIADSTVTLWAASAGVPKQLAQVRTGKDGRFTLSTARSFGKDVSLYLVAKGG